MKKTAQSFSGQDVGWAISSKDITIAPPPPTPTGHAPCAVIG